VRASSVRSKDGTVIAYRSLGQGPGLIVLGGALSNGSNYLRLAAALSHDHTVHVVERRGRPGSGEPRQDHSIEDESADLAAVAAGTGASVVFGHSFGGLVTLETARRFPLFDEVYVYEPGVSLHGSIPVGWIDGYQRRLVRGDRLGAFAEMVKHSGFSPRFISMMPVWYLRLVLRVALGRRWAAMSELLETNVVEHRIVAALDAPDAERFSTIAAHTVLLGGAKSPPALTGRLLDELAAAIPRSTAEVLPGMDHIAPETHPQRVAAAVRANRTSPASVSAPA
jgi:pimeloyl-ACP methyl ester carboxylesterase